MRFTLTPENLFLLAKLSKVVPDVTLSGTSACVAFKFRDGFVYIQGNTHKEPPTVLCCKKCKSSTEVLLYPITLTRGTALLRLSQALNIFNLGLTLEMETNQDLEKMLALA